MLITINQMHRYMKAADDTLALAENYADKGDEANAQAFATLSLANSQLAIAYMYARENSLLSQQLPIDQEPLPLE